MANIIKKKNSRRNRKGNNRLKIEEEKMRRKLRSTASRLRFTTAKGAAHFVNTQMSLWFKTAHVARTKPKAGSNGNHAWPRQPRSKR